MIYLYPANKMENLLALVDKIQRVSPLPIFAYETIIVQNPGMQHWLNLSLANLRGISMNYDYALPSQFLWKLLRTLASKEQVPDQSPYSREVLCWRIYTLLQSEEVINNTDFSLATRYWLGNKTDDLVPEFNSEKSTKNTQQSVLKCYQLAVQLADLYEQYLIFRPNWIHQWNQKDFTLADESAESGEQYCWQGKLWSMLTQEHPYDPIALIQSAVANIETLTEHLPPRIFFFGINAMPPIWLDFIHKLSDHIDVHFFHLNPCYAYWGDLLTEKQAAKALNAWCEGVDDISYEVGNPLLANLGQQGREFMAMLQSYSTINIDVFEDFTTPENNVNSSLKTTVLQDIQSDILNLQDKRQSPTVKTDDSVVIASAHSALREVQGLHDWLLHQFNEDPTLSPKDVLVMCPHVEDYAPYVSAVFSYGWQKMPDSTPPLPCSIADRISKDSEPLVAAFSSLIALPDSRFKVSELIGYLRLPALQQKFELTNADIDTLCLWIDSAAIHWGLNAEHKAKILAENNAASARYKGFSAQFTWEYGLSKLLKGFAYGDEASVYKEQYLLPHVEGGNSVLLGQLMLILEQLQYFSQTLSQSRTAAQWQVYLLDLVEQFFGDTLGNHDDGGYEIIHQAVMSLTTNCSEAKYDQKLDWIIVAEYLNHHFSQPDPGRQFMVGQVTFCSMLPMRSIPFKVIAILGLNDGDFPRQRQGLGFDLLALTKPQLGDRSRRGDDRYLFLEALISARQSLYLSYQGRNIKNNAIKQPSIVLQELLQYLTLGYGWELESESSEATSKNQLHQLAMQPFSVNNYQGKWPSFDPKWLSLVAPSCPDVADKQPNILVNELPSQLPIEALIRFFQHPAKYFAQQQLSLFLEPINTVLDDTEPFSNHALETYNLREALLALHLESHSDSSVENVLNAARLRGKFPDLPTTQHSLEDWAQDSERFSEYIRSHHLSDIQYISVVIPVVIPANPNMVKAGVFDVSVTFPVSGNKLVFCRSSSAKWKDYFTLYCYQLLLRYWQRNYDQASKINTHKTSSDNEKALLTINETVGFYFDTKNQKMMQCRYLFNDAQQVNNLQTLLEYFVRGNQTPLLLNGDISEKVFKAKSFEQSDFEFYWQDTSSFSPLGADPYIKYFWPSCPDYSIIADDLHHLYQSCLELREVIKS